LITRVTKVRATRPTRPVTCQRAIPIATRRQRVDAEARRLSVLGATMAGVLSEEGIDHHAVAMKDPEGNEFDIN
jgi:Glyoxalase-like domain